MKEALLYKQGAHRTVRCLLCAHRCVIASGGWGRCRVRRNDDGVLHTTAYGAVAAVHLDPVEKKPLFHFLPGTKSFSFAAVGCNFTCSFCQNWEISQAAEAERLGVQTRPLSPDEIVRQAVASGAKSISYTYTEPTVFMEYAYETARLAKKAGLANIFVTNGYMTEEALNLIGPYLDAANVDLKFSDDNKYAAHCGGHLEPVLQTIRRMHDRGIWVEVTTLVIAGLNDDAAALSAIAGYIAGVGNDMPWHVSAFHPDYKLLEAPVTPPGSLDRAVAAGARAGLLYIYRGNIAGEDNTSCHACKTLLIRRRGYTVTEDTIQNGRCPSCAAEIPGVFS